MFFQELGVALLEGMETEEEQDSTGHVNSFLSGTDHASTAPAPKVTSLRRQPPPESSTSIRIRGLVILSFWTVVLLLGFPTWWWTTSIHRARLPLQEMLDWADGKVRMHQRQPPMLVTAERLTVD